MTIMRFRVTGAVVLGAFLASFAPGAARPEAVAPSQAAVPGAQALPEAPGKEVLARVCSVCHGLDYVVPSDRTATQWRDTLATMKTAGALASDEEWKLMAEYVMANIAYLNVNKATAEDVRLVFAVEDKIAKGIVAYRDGQGGFRTIEDLKQAPDVDAKRIEALKGRLIFGAVN